MSDLTYSRMATIIIRCPNSEEGFFMKDIGNIYDDNRGCSFLLVWKKGIWDKHKNIIMDTYPTIRKFGIIERKNNE